MFTRDISLEDCVLDLIDNSLDSLTKTKHINVSADVLSVAPAEEWPEAGGPIGASDEVNPGKAEFVHGNVKVTLIASMAATPWSTETAGWYILCNGRVVKAAD